MAPLKGRPTTPNWELTAKADGYRAVNSGQRSRRGARRSDGDRRRIECVRDVRRAAARRRGWNNQDKCRRRHRGKTERFRSRGHKYLGRDRAPSLFLMIGPRSGARRNRRLVAGQVGVQRLPLMVCGLLRVEMHVRQRRGDRSDLHEHGERGGSQPAEHGVIVVNRGRAGS